VIRDGLGVSAKRNSDGEQSTGGEFEYLAHEILHMRD
jgi:hypothetical protein